MRRLFAGTRLNDQGSPWCAADGTVLRFGTLVERAIDIFAGRERSHVGA